MSEEAKNPAIPYKQLQQEKQVLGSIVTGVKYNTNKQLQNKIDCKTLRNITAELQEKLEILCNKNEPHRLQTDANQTQSTPNTDLLKFLRDTYDRIDKIQSNLSQTPIIPKENINSENEIHCLEQKIHKLEMGKLDLLKCNQESTIQLQSMIEDQQSLQQKLCYLENENLSLRQQIIQEKNNGNSEEYYVQTQPQIISQKDLSNLSFEDIIKEVKRMESECIHQRDFKQKLSELNEENERLRHALFEKQNENQSLFDKYNETLSHYQILCKKYLK